MGAAILTGSKDVGGQGAICAYLWGLLFAALLAGVNLYDLIPPAVGFGLMALIAGTAVLLSLRHGPMVALLGFVGGFLTPAWSNALLVM